MERFQHVEAVLMLGFCALCAGASMLEPRATPRSATFSAAVLEVLEVPVAPMITIVVTGKRLGAARKHAAFATGAQGRRG